MAEIDDIVLYIFTYVLFIAKIKFVGTLIFQNKALNIGLRKVFKTRSTRITKAHLS